jgi:DNA-binding MarR family transcriptional regulator
MSEVVFRLDNYLPFRLSVASSSVSTLLSSACSVIYGMKTAEWRLIAALSETGPTTQQELSRYIYMDKVSVSRAVQVLIKRRLIKRSLAPDDGRSHMIGLTPEGQSVLAEIIRAANVYEAALVAEFTPREVKVLKTALKRVQLAAEHAHHPARRALALDNFVDEDSLSA